MLFNSPSRKTELIELWFVTKDKDQTDLPMRSHNNKKVDIICETMIFFQDTGHQAIKYNDP